MRSRDPETPLDAPSPDRRRDPLSPGRARFVTATSQALALGVVLAVLAPAASVLSLEVVGTVPGARTPGASGAPADGAGGAAGAGSVAPVAPPVEAAVVEQEAVDAVVTDVPLTTKGGDPVTDEVQAPASARPAAEEAVVSTPEPVDGFGTVGVTWAEGVEVEEEDVTVEVRSRDEDGTWTSWTALEYHDDHAPDPGTAEARNVRPGTDPLIVGEVADVQARVTGEVPPDLTLSVVAPGESAGTVTETPALDTGALDTGALGAAGDDAATSTADAIALQASSAPKPQIFSRAQWGADERLRSGSPSYGSISGGFVHHTVNANDYTREQVPGILRSIYAYHTKSRGWSDVGYNFLVDRFGRIWEGRAGGVDRPVIGAHTYGYNHDSFAMSAIGNFESVQPSDAMLRAYGALMAWKLGLHGVDPQDRSVDVAGKTFQAISGHRDAGSTACPGRYLYDRLPAIRTYAGAAATPAPTPEPEPEPVPQTPQVTARQVDSDLVGTPHPDLVVRRASDGRGLVLPTGGISAFTTPVVLARSGWAGRRFLAAPDLTGDGRVDLLTFDAKGVLEIRPGLARGGFGGVARRAYSFRGSDLVASAGDVNGDGRTDLVARRQGRLVTFLRTRPGGFRALSPGTGLRGYGQLVGAGDVTGDGRADLWGRDGRGRIYLHRGDGRGGFSGRLLATGDVSGVTWIAGGVDYTTDAVPDLVARRTDGSLVVLPSRGDRALGRAVGPLLAPSGLSMISGAGQVTGTAAPDLLAARSDGALVVVPNRGTFDLGRPVDTGRSFAAGDLLLNAGDFTGDGHGDVILRRRIGSLWLYRGDGSGRLAAPVWIGGQGFGGVSELRVIADVSGDGRHDLLGRAADGRATVWPGNGAGRLQAGYAVEVTGATPGGAARTGYDWVVGLSDLRRRGAADLVVRDSSGYLYRLDGTTSGYRAPRYLGEGSDYDLGG